MLGLFRRCWSNAECSQDAWKQVFRKVRIQYQKCLAIWGCKREFEARENDNPILYWNRAAVIVEFIFSSLADVREKSKVVVISYCNRIDPLFPTRKNQFIGIRFPIVF